MISAERIRHLAWAAVQQAPWSPGMTATSLRQVALTSTVTSHNCEISVHTLAARTRQLGLAQISADLSAAADTAGRWQQPVDQGEQTGAEFGEDLVEQDGELSWQRQDDLGLAAAAGVEDRPRRVLGATGQERQRVTDLEPGVLGLVLSLEERVPRTAGRPTATNGECVTIVWRPADTIVFPA